MLQLLQHLIQFLLALVIGDTQTEHPAAIRDMQFDHGELAVIQLAVVAFQRDALDVGEGDAALAEA